MLLVTHPFMVSLYPSKQAVQVFPRGHLAQCGCEQTSQRPALALYPSMQDEQQFSLQLQLEQCGSSQGSHLPRVALKPGLHVLQTVGSATQLMQLGSLQASAKQARAMIVMILSITYVITKIILTHLDCYSTLLFPSLYKNQLLHENPLCLGLYQFKQVDSMSCGHFAAIKEPGFLPAMTGKVYWVCLYVEVLQDRTAALGPRKTYPDHNYGKSVAIGLTEDHKVYINCETFEIYCTFCKLEIIDQEEEQTIVKKPKRRHPLVFRQALIESALTQDVLFGANAEYPPSFQKERKGLCGLKANSVSSYLNATLQLLAAVPIIAELAALTDPSKVENRFVRALLSTIDTIWSGKYRICSADELEKEMLLDDANFHSYRFKTPQHLLYFIVKKLMEELHYVEAPCRPGQTTLPDFIEWNPSQQQKHYSFPRQLLAGECVLECVCKACGHRQQAVNRFQCLKVSYDKQGQGGQLNLCQLIQEIFNWRNNHSQAISRIESKRYECQACKEKTEDYYAFVRLPNHLVLELGDDQEGLDSTLPQEIDLSQFSEEHSKKMPGQKAVYQYVGSVYRKDKQFHTHIRHSLNRKEYIISNELISEGARSLEQVKLAIYRRAANPKHQPLLRNILSCLEVNINPIVPLPDFWSLYLKYHYHVQPLVNPFICTHGKLKPNISSSKMKNGPQRLPVEVYQYLLEAFGGRQITLTGKEEESCKICEGVQTKIAEVIASEREMASFADKLSSKKERVLISRTWLQSWKQFAYDTSKKGYRGTFGHIRPGPIKNPTQGINQDLKNGALKRISPEVWYFLQKFYGGGPLLSKESVFHPNAVLSASVDLRYDTLLPTLLQLYGPKTPKQIEALQIRSSTQLHQEEKVEGEEKAKNTKVILQQDEVNE